MKIMESRVKNKLSYKVMDLIFENTNMKITTILCMSRIQELTSIDYNKFDFLCDKEKEYLKTICNKRRILSFILGRYASKIAVGRALKIKDMKLIHIKNGIFNQPIVEGKAETGVQISISHCENIGISVAYPQHVLLGIDIEKIEKKRYETLKRITTEAEMKLISNNDKPLFYLTLLFTVKESLSKCLKTGLTVPIEILSVNKLMNDDKGYYGQYLNFGQYQFRCVEFENYVISLTYPKDLNLKSDIDKLCICEND